MRRNSSRGSASPSTYRGGSGRRRKRRSNRLAKCAAFIVGAYALVASLFYYRATHHDVGPRLRGPQKKKPPPRARVALALPFVGPRLPPFFKAFARSCGNAIGAVDVLLLLSDPDAVPVERSSKPPWLPENALREGRCK